MVIVYKSYTYRALVIINTNCYIVIMYDKAS